MVNAMRLNILIPLMLFFATSCATMQDQLMPRTASALEAVKTAYTAVCVPPPGPSAQAACDRARAAINDTIEVYTEINQQLKD